jgi:hypothetical protein
MVVHLDLPDPWPYVESQCSDCGSALPARVISFRQRWYAGQVCLRCRRAGWNLGTFATPAEAQQTLADFVRRELRRR